MYMCVLVYLKDTGMYVVRVCVCVSVCVKVCV